MSSRLLLLVVLALTSPVRANLKLFLKVEDISGESTEVDYQDWIDVTSISRGGTTQVTIGTTGTTAGRYRPQKLTIEMSQPAAFAPLATILAEGTPKQVSLQFVRPLGGVVGDAVLQEYVFDDCLFSKLTFNADDGADTPLAELSFEYTTMDWSVNHFDATGAVINRINRIVFDRNTNTVSSTTSTPLIDTDGDGMPNDWEEANSLDSTSATDRDLDPDLDGFSNYVEYLAGTDPQDSNSRLKLSRVTLPQNGTQVTLEWSSNPGRSYLIQGNSTDLATSGWQTLGTVPASAGSVTSFTFPATQGNHAFYRVAVRP